MKTCPDCGKVYEDGYYKSCPHCNGEAASKKSAPVAKSKKQADIQEEPADKNDEIITYLSKINEKLGCLLFIIIAMIILSGISGVYIIFLK